MKIKKHTTFVVVYIAGILLCTLLLLVFLGEVYIRNKYYLPSVGVIREKPLFLDREADYYEYDETVGHVHRAYAKREFQWQEHRKGKIEFRTNNLGFRKDTDTLQKKTDDMVRILVTGDSHTDGVIYNEESFGNQLEQVLNNAIGIQRFEVLNGGTGYYGPQSYYGFLKKQIYLTPDIYIVALYMGNDFLDALKIAKRRKDDTYVPPDLGYVAQRLYFARLLWARKIHEGAIHQAFDQLFYFKNFPKMQATALEITQANLQGIAKLCQQRQIIFITVLIPSFLDLEWGTDTQKFERIQKRLSLSSNDFELSQQLYQRMALWLRHNDIKYIDMLPEMQKAKQMHFFWKQDYHINDKGHKFISDQLYRMIPSVLLSRRGGGTEAEQ